MSADAPYTADQLEAGVANAIAAKDFPAAVTILEALAAVDLPRCVKLYDEIQDGLTFRRVLSRLGATQ